MRSGRQDVPVFLRVVEDAAGPAHDARHRVLVEVNRQAGLLLQQHVEPADQRAPARHYDAAIHDVAGQLRRRDLERAAHGIYDLLDRLLDSFADLARVYTHDLGDAGDEVAALDLHLPLFADRCGRADLDLDLLRRGLADEEVVVLAHELHDRLVQLVAARADRRVGHDARQGDHGDLGGPAADVDHHVAGGGLDRQAHTDRGGHRFGDHVDLLGPGGLRRIAHRSLLYLCDPARYADDDFRLHAEQVPVDDGLQEEAQHLLGDVEVGDDAVFERPHREDAVRRAAEHALGLEPDALDLAGGFLDGDDGGLVEHDALTLDPDEGVGRPEIDGDFVRRAPAPEIQFRPVYRHGSLGD